MPLAIVHGRRDRLIPFQSSLSVSITEMRGAHGVVVPGMGHAFDPVGHDAICDALDWVLGTSGTTEEQTKSGAILGHRVEGHT